MSDNKRQSLGMYNLTRKEKEEIERKARRFKMGKSEFLRFCTRVVERVDMKPDQCDVVAVDFGSLHLVSDESSRVSLALMEVRDRLDRVQALFESARYEEALDAMRDVREMFEKVCADYATILDLITQIASKVHVKIDKPIDTGHTGANWKCFIPGESKIRSL